MNLKLTWHKPLTMRAASARANFIYELDLNQIPEAPGVYIFMRRFGTKLYPLYVGKANNLRKRIKQQLNVIKLMKGIENSEIGARVLLFGQFNPGPAQNLNCLPLIEQALIRHFLSNGNELLNVQGTKLKSHTLISRHITGHFIPNEIVFE